MMSWVRTVTSWRWVTRLVLAVLKVCVPELAAVVNLLKSPLYEKVVLFVGQAELTIKAGEEKRRYVENHVYAACLKDHTPDPSLLFIHTAIQLALIRRDMVLPFGGGGLRGRGATGLLVGGGGTEDLMYSHVKVK